MKKQSHQRGFTLMEMLVGIIVIALFISVGVIGFRNMMYAAAHKAATVETYSALTKARDHTLASQGDTVFGVRISSTTVTYFQGPIYTFGSSTNKVYTFERGVTATGTLVTNGTDVLFTRLTGQTSAQGTIYLRNEAMTATTTIIIRSSGIIEYQ